jgi:secretion/DNA translocation related CpaE-like protein
MTAPLIVTRDELLLDNLLRLAAAAGVVPEVVPDVSAALRAWAAAPLVLVGIDLAAGLAAAKPARRTGVHVLAVGAVPDDAFRIALDLGAEDAADVGRAESWVVELLGDLDEPSEPGRVIGVVGGSGGAGATTFACAVAQVGGRSGPAVVLDLDHLGPGVDAVLGIDAAVGVRWEGLVQTVGRVSARSLREALPKRQRVGVLTFGAAPTNPPPVFAVRQALDAARRGHDVVVADLPRRVDALVDEVAPRCDVLALVVRPTVVGVASAQRVCARLPPGSLGLVVRGSGIPAGDVARILGRPLLAAMPDQRGVGEAVDLGAGPVRSQRGPLARAARSVLYDVPAAASA